VLLLACLMKQARRHDGIPKGRELIMPIVKVRQTTDREPGKERAQCDGESSRLRRCSGAETYCDCDQFRLQVKYQITAFL
jgi:hypothetical protein